MRANIQGNQRSRNRNPAVALTSSLSGSGPRDLHEVARELPDSGTTHLENVAVHEIEVLSVFFLRADSAIGDHHVVLLEL